MGLRRTAQRGYAVIIDFDDKFAWRTEGIRLAFDKPTLG